MKSKSLNLLGFCLTSLTINLVSSSPSHAAVLGFESGDFTNWLPIGNTSVQDDSYGVDSPEGNYQALLETGTGSTGVFIPLDVSLESGNPPLANGFLFDSDQITAYGNTQGLSYTQGSAIKLENPILLNSGETLTLTFKYNFLTNEDPSTGNDDLAFLKLNQQLIPLTSVKTATFTLPNGTPFLLATGYQVSSTYTLTTPGNYIFGFGVLDVNDFATTSGLLVDNVQINITTPPPAIPESTPTPWLWLTLAIVWQSIKKQKGMG